MGKGEKEKKSSKMKEKGNRKKKKTIDAKMMNMEVKNGKNGGRHEQERNGAEINWGKGEKEKNGAETTEN